MRRWLIGWRESPHAETVPGASIPARRNPRSAEALYCSVAIKRLEIQSSTLFTIGSTILPITAALLTRNNVLFGDAITAKISLFIGLVFYVLLVAFFVWSYRFSKWDSRPNLRQWREVTAGRSEEEMQRWLGDACVDAHENNEPIIERKARAIGWALLWLAGEAICLVAAVLIPLWPPW